MKSLSVNQNFTNVNSSFAELDRVVAQSPWQSQHINEVAQDNEQFEHLACLTQTLTQLSQQERWIVLVGAPKSAVNYINSIPTLDSARVLLVHPDDQTDNLWAIEQALMSGNSSAVLGWPGKINSRDRKRLQLASKRTSALAFIFSEQVPLASSLSLKCNQDITSANHQGSFH